MKRLISVFMSLMMILNVGFFVHADNAVNRIYSESLTVKNGEQITVPVKIENNDGFMGFAITVTYDASAFVPVSASKGSMLSGIFDNSIETSSDNSFKAVFTGTNEIGEDGVLFNMVFDVISSASGEYEIGLSYSQQDTFKEDWTDAVFNCESITVVVSAEDDEPAEPEIPSDEQHQPEKTLSEKMREWVASLPSLLSILVGIIVIPISHIVAVFE